MSRINKVLFDRKGFTLVELLVVISIILIVFTIAYNFFDFSNVLFKRTDDIATKQRQARIILTALRKDIGTALDVTLVSEGTYSNTEGKYTIFVEKDNPNMIGRLAKKDWTGHTEYIYTNTGYDTLKLLFERDGANPALIKMQIQIDGKVMAETEILCLNIKFADTPTDLIGNNIIYIPSE